MRQVSSMTRSSLRTHRMSSPQKGRLTRWHSLRSLPSWRRPLNPTLGLWSLWLDLKILARTIGVVTRPSGIYVEDSRRGPIVAGNRTPTAPSKEMDGCREREDYYAD